MGEKGEDYSRKSFSSDPEPPIEGFVVIERHKIPAVGVTDGTFLLFDPSWVPYIFV